ncbi:hypothetical protein LSUCC0031_06210 [Rhodobacterales bacterium LSUCC0031]|nr:hypothetical protein [Rhodobacterales bacterium LSUCC0031]
MTTPSFLDQDLCRLLGGEPKAEILRPSVIRSEFFRDYSLKRILEAPEAAWFDLLHTRGIGGKSTSAVAQVVAHELAARLPDDWTRATALVSAQDTADAPPQVAALAHFMQVWGKHAEV